MREGKGVKSQKGRRATLPRDQPDQPDQPGQAGDPGWPWVVLGGRVGDRATQTTGLRIRITPLPWWIPAVEGSTPNCMRQLHHDSANGRPRNDAEHV